GLDQVKQDLVVRHQHAAGLVDDGRVAQLLVRVPGGEDGHRRLVHGGVAEAGVEVASDEGRRRGPADAAARPQRADEFLVAAVGVRVGGGVGGDQGAGEVERRPGEGGVDGDAAGKDHQAAGVDGAAAVDVGDNLTIADADVLDAAVDVVGGVVDFPAADAKHG